MRKMCIHFENFRNFRFTLALLAADIAGKGCLLWHIPSALQ